MPQLVVNDLVVEVVRKPVRYLRLSVHMPDGRVRVSAPARTPEATIREFIQARQAWIRKHQAVFKARVPPPVLAYESGEMHYYRGVACQLQVLEKAGRARVALQPEANVLALTVPPGTTAEQRAQVLHGWYRARLREQIPQLLAKWEPIVGARANAWGIRQMRTRWGTCNVRARRIWLSLELIKRPLPCLEYVVVHELVHLHERLHNTRFWGLMSQAMPEWPSLRQALNAGLPQPRLDDAD